MIFDAYHRDLFEYKPRNVTFDFIKMPELDAAELEPTPEPERAPELGRIRRGGDVGQVVLDATGELFAQRNESLLITLLSTDTRTDTLMRPFPKLPPVLPDAEPAVQPADKRVDEPEVQQGLRQVMLPGVRQGPRQVMWPVAQQPRPTIEEDSEQHSPQPAPRFKFTKKPAKKKKGNYGKASSRSPSPRTCIPRSMRDPVPTIEEDSEQHSAQPAPRFKSTKRPTKKKKGNYGKASPRSPSSRTYIPRSMRDPAPAPATAAPARKAPLKNKDEEDPCRKFSGYSGSERLLARFVAETATALSPATPATSSQAPAPAPALAPAPATPSANHKRSKQKRSKQTDNQEPSSICYQRRSTLFRFESANRPYISPYAPVQQPVQSIESNEEQPSAPSASTSRKRPCPSSQEPLDPNQQLSSSSESKCRKKPRSGE